MWQVKYIDEALKEMDKLDKGVLVQVLAAIQKVSQNPLPSTEGGFGKPLGHHENNLTGFFKIKLKDFTIRVVYVLVRSEQVMNIVVVSKRDDNYVYNLAAHRHKKHGENLFNDIWNLRN